MTKQGTSSPVDKTSELSLCANFQTLSQIATGENIINNFTFILMQTFLFLCISVARVNIEPDSHFRDCEVSAWTEQT